MTVALAAKTSQIDIFEYRGYNRSMMQRFFYGIMKIVLMVGVGALLVSAPTSAIAEGGVFGGIDAAQGAGVPTNLTNGDTSLIRRIINILLYAVGVISVVMLILGGFRYVISGGQKEAVTAAKNTILYAIVGLLVAIFSYAIVRFVLGAVIGTDSSTDI